MGGGGVPDLVVNPMGGGGTSCDGDCGEICIICLCPCLLCSDCVILWIRILIVLFVMPFELNKNISLFVISIHTDTYIGNVCTWLVVRCFELHIIFTIYSSNFCPIPISI